MIPQKQIATSSQSNGLNKSRMKLNETKSVHVIFTNKKDQYLSPVTINNRIESHSAKYRHTAFSFGAVPGGENTFQAFPNKILRAIVNIP